MRKSEALNRKLGFDTCGKGVGRFPARFLTCGGMVFWSCHSGGTSLKNAKAKSLLRGSVSVLLWHFNDPGISFYG
ncbi:MAG: hypothetical protein JWM99_1697, partial [Verrucomicrobiales bacterium]|nr:hypothetical protein [Verrucomicrobiales bacterium]